MPVVIDTIPLITGRAPSNVTAGTPVTTLNGLTAIGATSATLTSAAGFKPGMGCLVDTLGNSEVCLITSVVGNVVTFADPLTIGHATGVAFSAANIPDGPVEKAGVIRSPYLAGG